MPGNDFAELLRESIQLIRERSPDVVRRMSVKLADAEIEAWVSRDLAFVLAEGSDVRVADNSSETPHRRVEIQIEKRDLLALIDGRAEPIALLRADRLSIRTPTDSLHDLLEVVRTYVLTILAIPESQSLLARYRERS